ncbi:FtsQ-type POTRA domain-containing protein [Eubacteriales bacterium OttesenSCG-928-G02]|nr:FtsQ-type POTRA domain-containing protein [Eubacteriales bacterium OttesenSCG-928-G02]
MDQQKLRRKAIKYESLKHQQQKKIIRRRIFYVSLLVIIIAAFFAVCYNVFFKVNTIKITGNKRYTSEEIIEVLNIDKGDKLFSFDVGLIESFLIKKMPYIKEVTISRSLPSTVKVDIIEEDARFYTYQNGDLYYLTETLTVLERTEGKIFETPLIEIETSDIKRCIVGEKLTFADTRKTDVFLELYNSLISHNIIDKIHYIDIKSRFDIYFYYEESRFKVYFGDITDADRKLDLFCGILEKAYDDQRGKLDISDISAGIFSPE